MDREQVLELLHKHIKNEKMILHCLASEAVMRKMAERLREDPEEWGLAGLLHDIDVELTEADPYTHGKMARELIGNVLPENAIDAIEMHNEISAGKERSAMFHHALAASETITGLIFATALVYPDKKLTSVKTKSVVKRMKEKHFAASVKRENIMECERVGLTIDEFADIALKAMCDISHKLGM